MAAVSQKISNLLGGISQQPDPMMLPGQVREAKNVFLDPTFGCRKRPSTTHIAEIADNLPANVKWLPIFRDTHERYAVAIYSSPQLTVRVWDLRDGSEKTVTISQSAREYFEGSGGDDAAGNDDIAGITISDYTLLINRKRQVVMDGDTSEPVSDDAFVVLNQVSYNTTYSIDLRTEDTNAQLVKVWKATDITVSPSSWANWDGGGCSQQGIDDFNLNHATDSSKTTLRGTLTVSCYPKQSDGDETYSRYSASVTLTNGGIGWRIGDTVQHTFKNKTYTITVTGETFTYAYASAGTANFTTPSDAQTGQLSVGDITAGLVTDINNNITDFQAEAIGNTIRIYNTAGEDFNLSVRGGSTDRAMTAFKGSVSNISELPSQCFHGTILKVQNTAEADADDYYVKFVTQAPGIPGAGSWEETVAPGVQTNINPSSMPHALIRQADGNFTLDPLSHETALEGWAGREVGDETSNPAPSFVDHTIYDAFFYQNRLGFLTEDSVVLSQPGDFFNFFSTSALTVADNDPIDMIASSTKPAFLKGAVGTAKGLVLFAESAQFLLTSNEIAFGPSTVQLKQISDFTYRSNIKPINTGISIIFVSQSENYSKVLEMAIDSVANRPVVADITRVIPELLPPDFKWANCSTNNNLVVFGNDTKEVWTFKFFNNGESRELAGWSNWEMQGDCVFFAMEDDTGYIIQYNDLYQTYVLVKTELIDDAETSSVDATFGRFTPRIDSTVHSDDLTHYFDPTDSSTVVIIPRALRFSEALYTVVSLTGDFAGAFDHKVPQFDASTGDWYIKTRDYFGDGDFLLGCMYNMKVQLPSIYVTQENKADRVFVPQVSFVHLDLYYSGSYYVNVDRLGYSFAFFEYEATPANSYKANTIPMTAVSRFDLPVMCSGKDILIDIWGIDPYPSSLTSYSWEGTYNNRGISNLPK